ncbi:MAG: hypothetical protein HYY16_02435 [Planctomycetes bacterium]|nr:hypothetical protein [Planctomycetota bacterium]
MTLALLLILAVQEEAPNRWEGFRWQGFPEGSSVVLRVSDTERSILMRFTVAKVGADAIAVKRELPGRSQEFTESLRDAALRQVGTEDVDIDGKTFTCAVYEKAGEEGKVRVAERHWMTKDVPGRVAKVEITMKGETGEACTTGRLTHLNQRIEIGGKTIPYAVFELTGRMEDGREGTMVRWVSERVPGFIVRQELRRGREGASREDLSVTELVEFEVK